MTFTALGCTTCYQDECCPEIKRHTVCVLHRWPRSSPKRAHSLGCIWLTVYYTGKLSLVLSKNMLLFSISLYANQESLFPHILFIIPMLKTVGLQCLLNYLWSTGHCSPVGKMMRAFLKCFSYNYLTSPLISWSSGRKNAIIMRETENSQFKATWTPKRIRIT